jgi:hypothetical protein
MCVLISKYELNIISIKEYVFHDKDNFLLYTRKQTYGIIKIYCLKLKYMFLYYKT